MLHCSNVQTHQPSQEVEWAEFCDSVATGEACRVCREVCVSCWPELSFADFAGKYHNRGEEGNKDFRAVVTSARVLLKARLAGKPTPEILPPTYVRARNERVMSVWYEALYVSVSELTRLCNGLGPKQLGLGKPMVLTLEDNTTLKGYILSLEGVDPAVAQSLRHIRVERRLGVHMDEELMAPRHQLIKGREKHVFEHVCDGHAAHLPSKLMKGNLRTKMMTLSTLHEKAKEVDQAKCGIHIDIDIVAAVAAKVCTAVVTIVNNACCRVDASCWVQVGSSLQGSHRSRLVFGLLVLGNG